MCGIAGIFYFEPSNKDSSVIKKMTDAISHRGPDAEAVYTNGPIALGHRRLSIIDISEKSNQPFFDTTGNHVIIFNGEIYNYKEIKNKIPEYPFQTTGDTEVVLAAFLKWGKEALQYLKGMFAFAIANLQSEEIFIARDRLGVKPLYYYKDEHHFIFASEIRTLLASGYIKREICRTALVDYLCFQSFQSPQTIINNVYELIAGNYLLISHKTFQTDSYWKVFNHPDEINETSYAQIKKKVKSLLLQSVERRMVSDVPVAAFLSGGIDSSAVVGLMATVAEVPETFNIAFQEKEFDESEYASLIARKFSTKHHKVLIQPEVFLEELPNALDAMDTPSGDGINTYVVSKAIRKQGIKVALSGVGGDELFAGYPIFKQWHKLQRLRKFWSMPLSVRTVLSSAFSSNDIRKQRIVQLIRMDSCTISSVYPVLRQVNSDETIKNLLQLAEAEKQLTKNLFLHQPEIQRFPLVSQLSIAEYIGYTCQTLLKDTDQMSMASSLEVREPFFDHELIEYVLRVPDKYKNGPMAKSLLVQSLEDLIPEAIYQRPKKGFVFPWNRWLRDELKGYCEIKIRLFAQRDIVHEKAVLEYYNDFLLQKNNVGYTNILLLIALENYIELHNLY